MNKFYLYIGLIIAVFFTSCKKDEIPPVNSTDPVFYMDFENDGIEQSIVAGDDHWELQTGTSQLMGYNVSFGEFINTQNQSSFRLDYVSGPDQQLSNDILHLAGASLFEFPDKIIEKFIVNGDLANIQSIEWSINGAPYCMVDLNQISGPGQYDICIKASFDEGCVRELCNTFYLGVARDVHARYYVETINASQKMCIANIEGDYDDISWELNGDNYGNGTSITLDSLQQGLYNLKMKVFKDGEIKGEWKTLVPVGNVLCDFRFFDIQSKLQSEIKQGLIFTYQDEDGVVYNTSLVSQQEEVSITEIQEYSELNEWGQKVVSFKLQGAISMKSVSGEYKTMTLNNVKMAVAI